MKLLVAAVKPHKFDELMEDLLTVEVLEIRVFDFKSYSAANSHTEVFRGHERRVSLTPKFQIQILADNENLIKADQIIKKHTQYEDGEKEIIIVTDAQIV